MFKIVMVLCYLIEDRNSLKKGAPDDHNQDHAMLGYERGSHCSALGCQIHEKNPVSKKADYA